MSQRQTGACLCGAVRYEVSGPLLGVLACHCSQCRRQSGHFGAATGAKADDVEIKDEESTLRWYHASDIARRGFCSKCGSVLFWQGTGSKMIAIFAGSLDQPTGLEIKAHIFCADKADYYEIDDGKPQFAGNDGPTTAVGD